MGCKITPSRPHKKSLTLPIYNSQTNRSADWTAATKLITMIISKKTCNIWQVFWPQPDVKSAKSDLSPSYDEQYTSIIIINKLISQRHHLSKVNKSTRLITEALGYHFYHNKNVKVFVRYTVHST